VAVEPRKENGDVDGWAWLWHTAGGMIVGFVVAVGAWSAAAQVGRNASRDQRPDERIEPRR
jgi:hypothetical protein